MLLCACTTRPPEIPAHKGDLEAEAAFRRLSVAALPDNWMDIYSLPKFLEERVDNEGCPSVTEEDNGDRLITGDGCVDAEGAVWFGTANWIVSDTERVEFKDFGVDQSDFWDESNASFQGEPVTWTLDGDLTYTDLEGGSDTAISIDLTVDWRGVDESFLAWINVEFVYAYLEGEFMINSIGGKVGIEDWGTAGLSGSGVLTDRMYYHPCQCTLLPRGGEFTIKAEQKAVWSFGDCECSTWAMEGGSEESFCEPELLQLPINRETPTTGSHPECF